MKKVYQKPEIEETIIKYSEMMLAGSDIQGSNSGTGITDYGDEDDIDI